MLLSSTADSILQLIVVLFVFVVVLALTYFTTRWIAGYQKNQMHNTNLEIIETMKISQNKYIQIVRTGKGKYLVIGIGKDEITKLQELSEEELIAIPSYEESAVPDFKSVLDGFQKRLQKK